MTPSVSDQQIALSLESQILTAFQRFAADILKNQSMNPAIASTPVAVSELFSNSDFVSQPEAVKQWPIFTANLCEKRSMDSSLIFIFLFSYLQFEDPPIYGTLKPSFTNFMAPGIILR